MQIRTSSLSGVSSLVLVLVMSGCRVESNKQGTGDNVKLATPFGGMQVKTNESVVADEVGIPVYPGATPVKKKEDGKDDSAADVDMNFGAFKMRIKALSYRTGDDPAKVAAFYRDALKKYGDVIQCEHDRPVGTPTQTSEGLTCDNKKSNHMTVTDSSGNMELKTGSQQHQHIVGIDSEGSGTKIGLVALDLPGHLSFGDTSDSDKQ